MLTVRDLVKLLSLNCDPDELVQILDISSEDLCERFVDRIEDKYDELIEDFNDNEDIGEDEGIQD